MVTERDDEPPAPVLHRHRSKSAGCPSCDAGVPYLPTVEDARAWARRREIRVVPEEKKR